MNDKRARVRTGRMPERDFQRSVQDAARLFGWVDWHHLRSRGTRAGWPDLVLLKPPRIVFAELKIPPNRPTAAQAATLEMLKACGCSAYCWTPGDWREIERVLKG